MDIGAPAVSVIIPCYRADEFIGMQLHALALQAGAPKFEVVLVDNGDNDNLAEIVAQYPQLTVRIVEARAELGTGYARNVGIAQSRSEFLLFCDADDVVAPTWVKEGAKVLSRYPVFSGAALPLAAEVFDRSDVAALWDLLRRNLQSVPPSVSSTDSAYPILLGCSFGMTRAFALSVGGFDRAFKAQGEDNDLAFRIVEDLGNLPVASRVIVAYRERAEHEKNFSRAFEAGLKHALVCARHNAWVSSPAYQGHWVARMAKELAGFLLKGQLHPDLAGRQLGVLAGRVRFGLLSAPQAHLGLQDDGSWGAAAGSRVRYFAAAA